MKRTNPNRDIVFDLRTLYREMFRDRSVVLSDREIRAMWEANADAPNVIMRECRTLDVMHNAVRRAREDADFEQYRALGIAPGNVVTLAA